jgi:hypothetical protein
MPAGYESYQMGDANADPLSRGPNEIGYADMMRYQMISQYQQSLTNPQSRMAQYQTAQVMGGGRFQYGLNAGQPDNRFFRRQADLNRGAVTSAVAGVSLNQAAFSLTAAGLEAAGIGAKMAGGAFLGGLVAPMAISAIPMHFINKGIMNSVERQRTMQTMAADVEQYRNNIGLQGAGYGTMSQLGQNLMSSAYNRGNFFNPQQQMDVLKTGLANDMLTARGKGSAVGDIKTFEKNFKELLTTTEMVVKTLKTTKEGGLAVIKEMQQQGFGTMGQIQSGVFAAQAYGNVTGLGAQNMLQLGAAGAAATQGTPWKASAGASMYQAGALMTGMMAKSGSAMANTVQMAGGVAQAGATLAQAQMNIMQSGIGSRVVAYMMNGKGELDTGRMERFMKGGVSGYEVNMGAANTGYALSLSGNRVLFGRKKNEILNTLANSNPEFLARAMQSTYESWSANRMYASEAAKRQAFAKMYSGGDERTENLLADWIGTPKAFGAMAVERKAAEAAARMPMLAPAFQTKLKEFEYKNFGGLMRIGSGAYADVNAAMSGVQAGFGAASRGVKWGVTGAVERLLSPIAPGGIWGRGGVGNVQEGYRNMYGLNLNIDKQNLELYSQMSKKARAALGKTPDINLKNEYGIDVNEIVKNSDNTQLSYLMGTLRTGIFNNRIGGVMNDPGFLNITELKKHSSSWNRIKDNQSVVSTELFLQLSKRIPTVNKQAYDALAGWEQYQKDNSGRQGALASAQMHAQFMNYKETQRIDNMIKNEDNGTGGYSLTQRNRDVMAARRADVAMKDIAKTSNIDVSTGIASVDLATAEKNARRDIRKFFGTDVEDRKRLAEANAGASFISKNAAILAASAPPLAGIIAGIGLINRFGGSTISAQAAAAYKEAQFMLKTGVRETDPMKKLEAWKAALKAATPGQLKEWEAADIIPRSYQKGDETITGQQQAFEAADKLSKRVVGNVKSKEVQAALEGLVKREAEAGGGLKTEAARNFILAGGAGVLDRDAIKDIASTFVMSTADVKGLYKQGGTSLVMALQNSAGKNYQGDPTRINMQMIMDQITKIRKGDKTAFYKLGAEDTGTKAKSPEEAQRNLEWEYMRLAQQGLKTDPSNAGRGLDTMVHAPVLNYWANRWVM